MIVGFAFGSAIRTFMLPGSGPHLVSKLVFRGLQRVFVVARAVLPEGAPREIVAQFYAPLSLLLVYGAMILVAGVGFAALFWSLGDRSVVQALIDSGLSISTLGSPSLNTLRETVLSVFEALIATTISALLIGYLPTIHSAYLDRERAVSALQAHLGETDSGAAILAAYADTAGADKLAVLWPDWIRWFADLGERHGSLSSLLFLRSPRARTSWVTTAGAVLDAAALADAALGKGHAGRAARCLRTGAAALANIVDSLELPPAAPDRAQPGSGWTVSRADFDTALAEMVAAGLPVAADRDAAWARFVPLRASYQPALLALCRAKLVPPGRWDAAQRQAEVAGEGPHPPTPSLSRGRGGDDW